MSTYSSKSNESDIKSIKSLIKQLAKYFQSLSYRQLEHEAQIKELRMTKEKDENSQKLKKKYVLMHLVLKILILLGRKALG